jgi:hypothetical protein
MSRGARNVAVAGGADAAVRYAVLGLGRRLGPLMVRLGRGHEVQDNGQHVKMETGNSRGTCSGCEIGHCAASPTVDEASLQGGRFALASLAFFVGPLLFAIAGTACYPSSPHAQLAGAVIGLALGGACWGLVVSRLAGKDVP